MRGQNGGRDRRNIPKPREAPRDVETIFKGQGGRRKNKEGSNSMPLSALVEREREREREKRKRKEKGKEE